jgi:hypothetical protein
MSPPDKHEVQVATQTLRDEGNVWLDQADKMQAAARKAQGLQIDHVKAGIFQVVVSSYDAVDAVVVDRCNEAQQRMTEVGRTLRMVAATYQDEDDRQAHEIRNLY